MRVLAEWNVPDTNGKRKLSCMHIFQARNMREAVLCAEWFMDLAGDQRDSIQTPWSDIRVTIDEGKV